MYKVPAQSVHHFHLPFSHFLFTFFLFRWLAPPCSKAMELFQHDPRFLAVDGDKEREELYEDFMVDLVKKVRGP